MNEMGEDRRHLSPHFLFNTCARLMPLGFRTINNPHKPHTIQLFLEAGVAFSSILWVKGLSFSLSYNCRISHTKPHT